MKNTILKSALAGLAFALSPVVLHQAAADSNTVVIKASSTQLVTVEKGKPKTIRTPRPVYEIVVGDPAIATVQPLTDRSFYVIGQKEGTTGISMFDADMKPVGNIDLEVSVDTTRLKEAIRQNVPDSNIKVTTTNGQVVLSGSAADQVSADTAKKLAEKFSGDGKDVINSVRVTSSQQVQLNVRFVEINRNAGADLGVKIKDLSNKSNVDNPASNSVSFQNAVSTASTIMGTLISGGLNVDVAINAMEQRGVARRLAEPNLVARSGESASFLAGGEFPIRTRTDDGYAVEYKKYGVSLEFTPVVLKDGMISLEIEPEVSSISKADGFADPIFLVRRARTSVDLRSGQSFMMAGMFQAENESDGENVPGIGRMPVLGALFSSKKFQRRETDLVMIVTPHLVRPVEPSTPMATPLDGSRPANLAEGSILQVDEVRTSATGPKDENGKAAPRTHGHLLKLDIDG